MDHQSKMNNSNQSEDGSSTRKRKYPFDYTSFEESSDSLHTTTDDIFPTYEKTQGTGHLLGSEYQYLMCALYALKCCHDSRVYDFELTTNNNKYKVFDDITINVKLKDKTRVTFVFQLKHGEPQRNLTIGDFSRQNLKNKSFLKNPYCLTKHIEFIKSVPEDNIICILFTNNTTSLTDDLVIDFDKNKVTVKTCDYFAYTDLLVNCEVKNGDIFHLKINSTNSDELANQFYLFTNQDNVHALRLSIEDLLKTLVTNDIYSSFDHFMRNWWAGNFILTKTDVITKLTELSLSPFLKTLSGEYKSHKSKQLAQCILNFDISIVDSCDDSIVTKIWEDAEMLRKMTSAPQHELAAFDSYITKICMTASKFALAAHAISLVQDNITFEKTCKVIASLSDVQISKVLWYLDLVPLVVRVDDRQQVESVLRLLDGHFKKKKFVFLVKKEFEDIANWKIFHTLTDLISTGNKELYMYVVNNFYVSLQGKRIVALKDLLQVDTKLSDLFTVKELLHMTEKTMTIGQTEEIPDLYISRKISAGFVDTQKLLQSDTKSLNTLLIINCEKRYEFIFKNRPVVELSLFLTNREYDKIENLIILSTNGKCTIAQFDAVCKISGKSVFLFQNFNEKSVLLLKNGDLLEELTWEDTIDDVVALKYFTNPLNYVCAPAGMGKSTLFSVLNKNGPPQFWSVYVNLRHFSSFLRKNPDDEDLLRQFLQQSDDCFFNRFKTLLVETKKLYIFLDEIDLIGDDNIDHILNFVRRISSEGAFVWISSRDHLQPKIVERLKVVPLQLAELDEEQQKNYFSSSLQIHYNNDEIQKIVEVVFRSVRFVSLLRIPLNLYIIATVFNEDRTVYEKVKTEDILPLSLIYKWVFNGVVKFFCKKISLDQIRDQLDYVAYHHLEQYQVYSLKYCLEEDTFAKLQLNLNLLKKFTDELKSKGDKLGLIRKSEPPTFVHQKYAEYFVASWMSDHLHLVNLLQEEYFSEKTDKLRFVFDTILAEDNPVLVSVIYQNWQRVGGNLDHNDRGGRSLLHLACSYGTRYSTECAFDTRVGRESETYIKLMDNLFLTKNSSECDELFNLTCLSYAIRSRCLYPVEKLLDHEEANDIFDIFNTSTLAFYACQLGYSNLLRLVIEKDSGVVNEDFGGCSLLELAVLGCKDDNYKATRVGNVEVLKMLLDLVEFEKQNTLDRLLDLVCKHGCLDMVETLVTVGGDGNTMLHLAANYGTLDKEMLSVCKQLNIGVKALKPDGKDFLDIAYKKDDTNLLSLLLKEDSDASAKLMTPLHYAVTSQSDMEIVDYLLGKGVDPNARNSHGFTALELASGDYKKLLKTRGLYGRTRIFDSKKEEKLSRHFQTNLTFGGGEKMETESISQSYATPLEVFQKRSGTTDMGRDYEHLVIAHLVLNLMTDDNVVNFQLSSDDERYDAFDDVVVRVMTKRSDVTYAIQLKHSARNKPFSERDLTAPKGNFSINKYFEAYRRIHERKNSLDCIVFTNQKFGVHENELIGLFEDKMVLKVVKCQPELFLNTSDSGDTCYKFQVARTSGTKEFEQSDFIDHFFLYTNQKDVRRMDQQANKTFNMAVESDKYTFTHFIKFIQRWCMSEGKKEKLNKKWIQNFLSLSVLSPFIKPLSVRPTTYKMTLLRKLVSQYYVTFFEEKTYDVIKYMWGDLFQDTPDERQIKKTLERYFLLDDFRESDLDDVLLTKFMWLEGRCPLIVTSNPSTLKAIELCPHQKFILLGECPAGWQLRPSVFHNLRRDSAIVTEVLAAFKCSIQGKTEVSLMHLVQQDENFLSLTTPSDLAEMVEDTYQIGDEESLPKSYLVRFLSRNIISSKYLEEVDRSTLILISCLDRPDDIEKYNLTKLGTEGCKGSRLYCEGLFPFEEFEKLFIGVKNCHHFKFLDDGHLEWLQSRGDVSDLDAYRLYGYFAEETEFIDTNLPNKMNIVSGPPGIGKSQLLRHFKHQIQSLAFIISSGDVVKLVSTLGEMDVASVKEFILGKCDSGKSFEKKVVKMLIEKNQVVFMWDGLDELLPKVREVAICVISELSKNVVQWITCREHLEKQLETRFSVLAHHIRPFNQDEQRVYMKERLLSMNFEGDVEVAVANIMSALRLPQQENIIGVPLQIYMATELLCDKNSHFPSNKLSLVDIYDQFINLKYDAYFRDKLNLNPNDAVLRQVFDSHKKTLMENYEAVALQTLFPEDFLKKINLRSDGLKEDPFGFVVETKNVPSFIHSSFAEYFAACYLKKRFGNIPDLRIIFDEKYTNVRFFFDLLLAEDSSVHVAVLVKNLELVRSGDLSRKDLGGRSPLHLAASWGRRYPVLRFERKGEVCTIKDLDDEVVPEDSTYATILDFLLDKCDVSDIDTVFKMSPLSYSDATNCVYAKIKLLHKEPNSIIDDNPNILCYSAKLGYDDALDLCKNPLFIVTEKNRDSLLHIAAQHKTYFIKLLNFTTSHVNYQNREGKTPLHCAIQLGVDVVHQLVCLGANVNLSDASGVTPLHIACSQGQVDCVVFLIQAGADLAARTRTGGTPLHAACGSRQKKVVEMLIACGADVNVASAEGNTPLHVACRKGYGEIVRFLLGMGADGNVANMDNLTPLQVAAREGNKEVVEYLNNCGM